MKQVRRGVFETNSSSTHSICIASDGSELRIPEELWFDCGEFGWEWCEYHGAHDKASYLYSGIFECYVKEKAEEAVQHIEQVLNSYGIACHFEPPHYETYTSHYDGKEHTYTYIDNASVDHGDRLEDFLEAILSDDDRLMRYLFSDKSFVITGNDNICEEEMIKINVDYPHEEYFKGN